MAIRTPTTWFFKMLYKLIIPVQIMQYCTYWYKSKALNIAIKIIVISMWGDWGRWAIGALSTLRFLGLKTRNHILCGLLQNSSPLKCVIAFGWQSIYLLVPKPRWFISTTYFRHNLWLINWIVIIHENNYLHRPCIFKNNYKLSIFNFIYYTYKVYNNLVIILH